jgi:hypothetical protein
VRRALLVLALAACTSPPAKAPEPSPPTEADACERFCERLGACAIAPTACAAGCERDRANMRAGVYPGFVACLDRELPEATCAREPAAERRAHLSMCWAATLEAWWAREGDAAVMRVVHAVCTRQARCGGDAPAACEQALHDKLAGSAQAKSLAVIEPEAVESLAKCVETRDCAVADPVDACGR